MAKVAGAEKHAARDNASKVQIHASAHCSKGHRPIEEKQTHVSDHSIVVLLLGLLEILIEEGLVWAGRLHGSSRSGGGGLFGVSHGREVTGDRYSLIPEARSR